MSQSSALCASIDSIRERLVSHRYLDRIGEAQKQQTKIEPFTVQTVLENLTQQPEVGFMFGCETALPAYNIQTSVDANMRLR
jgi:hypothetical protein